VPDIVDIVVPVFRGERETRACLESVLSSPTRTLREIVVVDDASPEPALSQWLRGLGKSGQITLLEHTANRGFVASVNEGMALHPDRDVVLLNSDTEVAAGWLDRLAAHASRDAAIATTTPFSNNATICSYPRTLVPNDLPETETTASLDGAFAMANAGRSAETFTAVGFCMHIARRALERIGPFDEARYGAGYGEEVDFCMRAARAGMRHAVAGDVFVRHLGEVSFGTGGTDRRVRAQAIVDELYPEFQVRLRAFLADDPLLPLRRRVDLERLRRASRPRMLAKSPEEAIQASPRFEPLMIEPAGAAHVRLAWARHGEEFSLWFGNPDWNSLTGILRYIGLGGTSGDEPPPELDAVWLRAPAEEPAPSSVELAVAQARIAELARRLSRMQSSRSWRISAPLRWVRGLLSSRGEKV
jgi:GT2 family glycosyltransferase